MKKYFYACLVFLCSSVIANAAPGDTTWVQAQSDEWLEWYGDYDSTVSFPNGTTSYRKVYMNFTLGKYICPGNPQYCSDWDYTVQVFAMTAAGDTFEIGRLITPYANSARMPANWKQRYMFDVTDFAGILKDDVTIRVHYSGYSGGFTANVKFAMIEGTPARNVLGIDRIYHGGFSYGNAATPIDNFLPQETRTVPANTQSSEMKFTVTGHGSDGNYCSEFCSKYYSVLLNGNQIDQVNIWRDNCGFNHLYPQNGTWVYDRANWCPGDQVAIKTHPLAGLTAGGSYDINVDFEPYTKVGSGNPSYIIESSVVYYGGFNRAVDADLLDIISPNNFETHFRENSFCGEPMIKVKNNGSQPITSVSFQYAVGGGTNWNYTWNGTIAPLQEVTIELPEPWELRAVSGLTANHTFNVKILTVNGQADEDATNNELTVAFKPSPRWEMDLIVRMFTNNATIGGVSQTTWKILDLSGATVVQRSNLAPSTQYTDTINLGPGCYKLVVEDLGCDGLSWWASPASSGNFSVRRIYTPITYPLEGYFNGDFGCGFEEYFTTAWPTDVPQIQPANVAATIEAVPNPARKNVTISLTGVSIENSRITVLDAMGRMVIDVPCTQVSQNLDVEPLANGVYTVVYQSPKGKLQTRLLVTK